MGPWQILWSSSGHELMVSEHTVIDRADIGEGEYYKEKHLCFFEKQQNYQHLLCIYWLYIAEP